MTQFLADVASWQVEKAPSPIDYVKLKAAGFTLVNIKSSQGVSYIWTPAAQQASKARTAGLGIGTFHWLDNTGSGSQQASIAYKLMKQIGGGSTDGMSHQCDCEDSTRPATWAIWSDYVKAMQDYLGRHIAAYTGDWWWQPRGWNGASLTPYVWAAPNHGYDTRYPGDTSADWICGYGGWKDYSLLQYAVGGITGVGGGNISKTAIRDPAVWTALTGGTTMGTASADVDRQYQAARMEAFVQGKDKSTPYGAAPSEAIWPVTALKDIQKQLDEIQSALAGKESMSTAELNALATQITTGLVASNANGLTEADHAGIEADVLQVLQRALSASLTSITS